MVRICRAGDQLSAGRGGQFMSVPELYEETQGALAPLTLQDIEADAAQLVDVGVVDLGQEADLRGHHRVVVCQE